MRKTANPCGCTHTHTHTHTHNYVYKTIAKKTIVNFACKKDPKNLIYKSKTIDIKLMHRKTVY